jgi:glycosyltransferase involved in cell wall biosynthesis
MAAAVRRLNPDLVHVHYIRGLAWGLPLAGGSPCVATPWGSDVLEEQGSFREWYSRPLTRSVLRHADTVTVPSAYLETRVRPLAPPDTPIVRIGWGVNLARFRPDLEVGSLRRQWHIGGDRRVIFSPRLARPFYNHERVIRALPAVRDKVREALLVVGGHSAEPGYVEELKRLASDLGVGDQVRFLGVVSDAEMPRWFNLAEAVVMVPPSDGLPLTLLEAMACGAMPVLNRLPQYAELIRHGTNGFLVDPEGDLAEILIEALTAGIKDAVAKRNRAMVEGVADQDREMERMEEYYRILAGARPRPAGEQAAWSR